MQDTNKSNKMFVQVDCFESIMYCGLSDCDRELLLVKILTYWLIDHDKWTFKKWKWTCIYHTI